METHVYLIRCRSNNSLVSICASRSLAFELMTSANLSFSKYYIQKYKVFNGIS